MEYFCPHHLEIGLSKGNEKLMSYFAGPSMLPIPIAVTGLITPTNNLVYLKTERDQTNFQLRKMEEMITNLSIEMDKKLKKISNAIPTRCYTYGDGTSCSIN